MRAASAVAFDSTGNLYIADADANQVYEATLAGDLVLLAGTAVQGFAGDGGPALAAELNRPQGLAAGSDGTLYVADTGNHRVRAIGSDGVITTVAGTGVPGFSGDGGSATLATLRRPTALALDGQGALLICDTDNHRVRLLRAGVIATVAGSGKQGFVGDGGPAQAAALDSPEGIAVSQDGRIFVADTHNHRVRVVALDGTLRTYAGTGVPGFAGDGTQAAVARLSGPRGLALGNDGRLLIADGSNQRVRAVTSDGIISTVAGSGVEGASTDGAVAVAAAARNPRSVAVSVFGNIAYAESGTVHEVTGNQNIYQPAALVTGRTSTLSIAGNVSWTYGQGVAAVSVTGPVGTPQGEMEVEEGGSTIAAVPLSSGSANVDLRMLGAGTHSLQWCYGGDGLNPAATHDGGHILVSPLTVTATANAATVTFGSPLPPFSGTISGVLPQDAANVTAVYASNAGNLPQVGSYPIAISLTGSRAANYTVSAGSTSGQLTVLKATSTTVLADAGQVFTGVPFGLSATVLPAAQGQPTGVVEFLDGNTVIGTAKLNGGMANAMCAGAGEGSHSISVAYLGDGNFLPSASTATAVAVSALPDFGLTSPGLQTAAVSPGATASFVFTVTAQPGPFTGAVSLSVTGLPAGASVDFSPPQVVPGAGTAIVTMSVHTVASSTTAQETHRQERRSAEVTWAACLVAVMGCRKRRGRTRLLCLLVTVGLLAGCGARTVGEGVGGVLSQSFSLTVTGTATNLAGSTVVHTLPLTLTVEQ